MVQYRVKMVNPKQRSIFKLKTLWYELITLSDELSYEKADKDFLSDGGVLSSLSWIELSIIFLVRFVSIFPPNTRCNVNSEE